MARTRMVWPLAGILSGLVILAGSAAPSEARFGGPPLTQLQEQLGLTDDQVRAIHQANERQWESRRLLFKALSEARRSLRELILKGADEAAVQAKTTEVQQLLAQQVQMRLRTLQDLAQILTPEQREKLLRLRPGRRTGALAPAV